MTSAGSPPRTRVRRVRHGRPADRRPQPGRLAPRRATGRAAGRDPAGRGRRARAAGCHLAGGHSIDDPEPKYGLAVTGLADPDRLLRIDAARAGDPISLTKPLGIGVLNNRHKATGEVFPQAVETMAALNAARRPRRSPPASARPPTSPASACSVICSSWPARPV